MGKSEANTLASTSYTAGIQNDQVSERTSGLSAPERNRERVSERAPRKELKAQPKYSSWEHCLPNILVAYCSTRRLLTLQCCVRWPSQRECCSLWLILFHSPVLLHSIHTTRTHRLTERLLWLEVIDFFVCYVLVELFFFFTSLLLFSF